LRAGFEHFKSFEQDAKDFAALSTTKLNKPRLGMPLGHWARSRLIDGITTRCLSVSGPICIGVNSLF
jgi:hypothetical protein